MSYPNHLLSASRRNELREYVEDYIDTREDAEYLNACRRALAARVAGLGLGDDEPGEMEAARALAAFRDDVMGDEIEPAVILDWSGIAEPYVMDEHEHDDEATVYDVRALFDVWAGSATAILRHFCLAFFLCVSLTACSDPLSEHRAAAGAYCDGVEAAWERYKATGEGLYSVEGLQGCAVYRATGDPASVFVPGDDVEPSGWRVVFPAQPLD